MKSRFPILIILFAIVIAGFVIGKILFHSDRSAINFVKEIKDNDEQEARYTEMRAQYDFDMLKDPVIGKIPTGISSQELEYARTIPEKGSDGNNFQRPEDLNTYYPAGPNNQGGRTRGLAYDIRYNGTSNRVILAGGVSGGIMRSIDGGATWTRVSPDNEIHNVSSIAQDPRNGNQNTWYAGGGEPVGNSASEVGAVYLGFGIYKSTDNGVSWVRLTPTVTDFNGSTIADGTREIFDHPFDFIHKLVINPVNGDVYVCGHRRLLRSIDGGTSFQTVFGSAVAATASGGQLDLAIANTGKFILAVNGGNPDPTLRGVWTSTTANLNSWTRIAGGTVLGTDSVAGWRGNSYTFFTGSTTPIPKRILLGMAPSNQNILYVVFENGLSNTTNNAPEADMYKLDMTSGNNWTNLSANMPDFPGSNAATDPFAVQGGYDLFVTVKPDDPNFVLLGGSSLYRSTNGFASTANTSWIGGYGNTLPNLTFYGSTNNAADPTKWSHPDIHNVVFNPSNFSEVICADDGGLQITSNIAGTTAGVEPIAWNYIRNYQTLQYYHVSMDPGSGRNNFVGGAQDNGSQFRDKMQLLGTAASDSNNHIRFLGGDGGHSGMSQITIVNNNPVQYIYASFQLGNLRRFKLAVSPVTDNITPNGLTTDGTAGEWGEFVTNLLLNPDNTSDLYYVNYNRLFRTTADTTVTPSTWTELTNVGAAVNPANPTGGTNIGIRALAISRGPYITSHTLYIGTTNGKIFRLYNPRNALTTDPVVDITPSTGVGWTTGSNVQDISVNPNNDDEIMAIVTNYGVTSIWWTNNAKSTTPTWRNAEGNLTLPSIRSCMIVVKKDASNNPVTEYYVGTSVGLYSAVNIGPTLIGGGSPAWQREGGSVLNFAVVVSLAYRPVDNIMVIGTHGNGMYYTFLGTPNFNANQSTGVSNPPIDDKNFIKSVFPTISNNIVEYRVGNLTTIRKISVQLFSMNGQLVMQNEASYQDGSIDVSKLNSGAYILSIYSDNKKYRHLQKIMKQ